jgi:UDP-N-acetyl-2-amino-2-deoxyglucuronate dehydrogenase
MVLDGEFIEFSDGFTDLHTQTYEQILLGNGFGLMDAYPSIDIVYQIRNAKISNSMEEAHPYVTQNNLSVIA